MVVSDFEANNEFYGDVPPPLPLVSVQRLVEERMSILRGANLIGADLLGADLAGEDLAGVNLEEANLIGEDLAGANLEGANLAGANLTRADFTGANLTDADLGEADITRTDFTTAKVSRMNLHCIKMDDDYESDLAELPNVPEEFLADDEEAFREAQDQNPFEAMTPSISMVPGMEGIPTVPGMEVPMSDDQLDELVGSDRSEWEDQLDVILDRLSEGEVE